MPSRCWAFVVSLLFFSNAAYPFVTINHDAGGHTFEKTPQRIVALTWSHTEILLTLGVTPVGVATVSGYRKWQSNNPPLPDGVVDVGHRGSPSLEAIAHLKPDLILGYNFRHLNQFERLNSIAPTMLYQQYPSAKDKEFRYFNQMLRITRDLGKLLNKSQQAESAIATMYATLNQAQQKITAQRLEGEAVVLGKFVGMGMGLRVFADNSLSADIANKLGLKNQWHYPLPGRDFSHIQLPQMLKLGNAHFIIFGDDSNETEGMRASSIWPHLEFVQSQRFHRVDNSWGFGGPVSATILAQRISSALLGN